MEEHKTTFDNAGRILTDYIFRSNGFSGKRYIYKDLEKGIYYNVVEEYKNSDLVMETVFDEDIKGIRYENIYRERFLDSQKFYNEKAELIGESLCSGFINGFFVEYYSEPMKVSKVMEFWEEDGSLKKSQLFSIKGNILQEDRWDMENGYRISFNEGGQKIGEVTFLDYHDGLFILHDGVDVQYDDMGAGRVQCVDTYKNGELIKSEEFF